MIYTFGCSFTKWYWPTWADWVSVYTDHTVTNLAYPGHTNSRVYYQILELSETINKNDHVYIAWGANHRVSTWYDQEWVNQKDIQGFFPATNGKLWHGEKSFNGLWRCHPDYQPSLTDMIINNWNTILNTQMLLDRIGCTYTMMFCQNPWMDTREQFVPQYKPSWDSKGRISTHESKTAAGLIKLNAVRNLLRLINWSAFVKAPKNPYDPKTYVGIWDFMLGRKEYVMSNHQSDSHPNTLVHHDWAIEILGVQPSLREHAVNLADQLKNIDIPDWSAEACVTGENRLLNQYQLIAK